jgi:Flp pilus assembly protein TadB
MSVVVAGVIFGGLLSAPLGAVLLLGWLFGAPLVLAAALLAWGTGTVWMAVNTGVRHRRQRFLEALVEAPGDVVAQLGRLVGVRPRGLRPL